MLNFLNTDRSSDNLRVQSSEDDVLKHIILGPLSCKCENSLLKPAVQGSAMEVVELGRG